MPRASRSSATLPFTELGQHLLGGRHGGFRRCRAHVGDRLRFGLRDLGLGHLGAARDELFHLGLRFGRDPLGLGLGALDDRGRLFVGLALLALYSASSFCASSFSRRASSSSAWTRLPRSSSALISIFGTPT